MSSPVYPIFIQKYNSLVADPNADVMTKINSIIDSLNQTGKLTNDIVDQWNKVMAWTMGDGLSTDLTNAITSGKFDDILKTIYNAEIGDLTTLQTTDKSSLTNALNEVDGNTKANTSSLAEKAPKVFVTPEDYGAKGDGITDDRTAIINAISNGNFIVFDGTKTYAFSGVLNLDFTNKHITSTNGKATWYALDAIKAGSQPLQTTSITGSNFIFENIHLSTGYAWVARLNSDGTSNSSYTNARNLAPLGLIFNSCNDFIIRNCQINNTYSGIETMGCTYGTIQHCYINNTLADGIGIRANSNNITVKDCKVENNGDGAYSAFGLDANGIISHDIIFDNCYGNNIYGGLIEVYGAYNITAKNCVAYNVQRLGLFLIGQMTNNNAYSPYNITLENCKATLSNNNTYRYINFGNGTSSVRASNITLKNCVINNPTFTATSQEVLLIAQYTDYLMIDNCYFNNVSLYFSNSTNVIIKNNQFNLIADMFFTNVDRVFVRRNNISMTTYISKNQVNPNVDYSCIIFAASTTNARTTDNKFTGTISGTGKNFYEVAIYGASCSNIYLDMPKVKLYGTNISFITSLFILNAIPDLTDFTYTTSIISYLGNGQLLRNGTTNLQVVVGNVTYKSALTT